MVPPFGKRIADSHFASLQNGLILMFVCDAELHSALRIENTIAGIAVMYSTNSVPPKSFHYLTSELYSLSESMMDVT